MAEAGRACVLGVDGRAGEPERALGEPVKPQEGAQMGCTSADGDFTGGAGHGQIGGSMRAIVPDHRSRI